MKIYYDRVRAIRGIFSDKKQPFAGDFFFTISEIYCTRVCYDRARLHIFCRKIRAFKKNQQKSDWKKKTKKLELNNKFMCSCYLAYSDACYTKESMHNND